MKREEKDSLWHTEFVLAIGINDRLGAEFLSIIRKPAMSSAEYLKQFIIDKLAAAAEEIFAVFHTVIVEYEEELERRRKLFDVAWNPVVKLRRIG